MKFGGKQYKINDKGMPIQGGGSGDLFITLELVIPMELTKKQIEVLRTVFKETPRPRQDVQEVTLKIHP